MMGRMPSRPVTLAIVAFWLLTAGWFVLRDMIPTWRTGNVDTLPQFDIPLGSQNEGPFVAKRPQGIWSEPVHAKISKAAIAMDHHVAEVLEFRAMAVIHIRHLRHRHLRHGGSGEVNELVGLVRAEVAESAAVAHRIPEPFGPVFSLTR